MLSIETCWRELRSRTTVRKRWGVVFGMVVAVMGLIHFVPQQVSAFEITKELDGQVASPFMDSLLDALKNVGDEQVKDALNDIKSPDQTDAIKANALLKMGVMYLFGNSSEISKNTTMAMRFLNESSNLGNAHAQYLMGIARSTGLWGVPRDDALAILYMYFASLAGDVGATMALGYRHFYGVGVPKNCETALLYYELAANTAVDAREAEPVNPVIYDQRPIRLSSLEEKASSKAPADDEVIDYYRYSAEKGDPAAMNSLATIYYYGARGVQQDLALAVEYFQKAYDVGSSSSSAANLGHMYAHGLGVPQDFELALAFFEEAAHEGNAAAQNGLALMHLKGQGVREDHKKALKLLKSASQQGNSEALYNLGVVYMGAYGDEPDYTSAMQHFQVAAQHSHTLALHKLGQMHMHGLGTRRSCHTAVDFFKNVAERGPWVQELKHAATMFAEGNNDFAFSIYIIKEQEGYEVAQHNAAWMIDNGYGYRFGNYGELSVRLYKQAATQGNIEANLKIGDYYYYGKGGLEVNYEKATAHYRQASKRQNAQAMFNLGIMHEHGIGLPQDFFLAKRFYDMAQEVNPEASIPVMLALWKLKYHMFFLTLYNKYFKEKSVLSNEDHFPSKDDSLVHTFTSYVEMARSKIETLLGDLRNKFMNITQTLRPRGITDFVATDTFLISILTILLFSVLFYRSERRNNTNH